MHCCYQVCAVHNLYIHQYAYMCIYIYTYIHVHTLHVHVHTKFLICTRAYWRLTKSTRTGIGADTLVTPQDGSSLSLPLVSPLVFLLCYFIFKSKVPSPLSVLCSIFSQFYVCCKQILTFSHVECVHLPIAVFWSLSHAHTCVLPLRLSHTQVKIKDQIVYSIVAGVWDKVLSMCVMDVCYGCVIWMCVILRERLRHQLMTHILRTITHMCVIVRKITHLCVLVRILCMCASDIKWSFKSKVIRTRYS